MESKHAPDDGAGVELAIRQVELEQIIDLRHVVLREGLPRSAAIFDGDELPTALHFGAFAGDQLVGCASMHLNSWQSGPAWQLRGMAIVFNWQRSGAGRRLLSHIQQSLSRDDRADMLWCNARVPAIGFYERMGWEVVSEVFEIPTAGPHVKMVCPLIRSRS